MAISGFEAQPRSGARPLLLGLVLAGAGLAVWARWAARDGALEQRTRQRLS